jgi:hypothetical protein
VKHLLRTLGTELGRRLGPFLALLDARYMPLLFAVIPQAWAVYAWLLASDAPPTVAAFGAVGYEAVYIAAVAWAEYGASNVWAQRRTAFGALLFSIAVAVYHYWPAQSWGALLHAGFPLVAYLLTLQMHAPTGAPAHPRADDAPAPTHPAPQITNTVQVAVAPMSAPPQPVRALPAHDAPTMPALVAYACKKCGAPVASGQKVAASARWGCASCKER